MCLLKSRVFFISSTGALSGYQKDLQALNLIGAHQGEPRMLLPSCTKPREPTIDIKFAGCWFSQWKCLAILMLLERT